MFNSSLLEDYNLSKKNNWYTLTINQLFLQKNGIISQITIIIIMIAIIIILILLKNNIIIIEKTSRNN